MLVCIGPGGAGLTEEGKKRRQWQGGKYKVGRKRIGGPAQEDRKPGNQVVGQDLLVVTLQLVQSTGLEILDMRRSTFRYIRI